MLRIWADPDPFLKFVTVPQVTKVVRNQYYKKSQIRCFMIFRIVESVWRYSSWTRIDYNNFCVLVKRTISKVKNIEILGPVNAPIFKIKNKFRSRLLIRCSKNRLAQKSIWLMLKKLKIPSRIKLAVDVDPLNFN